MQQIEKEANATFEVHWTYVQPQIIVKSNLEDYTPLEDLQAQRLLARLHSYLNVAIVSSLRNADTIVQKYNDEQGTNFAFEDLINFPRTYPDLG